MQFWNMPMFFLHAEEFNYPSPQLHNAHNLAQALGRTEHLGNERVQSLAHVLIVEYGHYISLLRILHEIQRQRPLNCISVILLLLSTR